MDTGKMRTALKWITFSSLMSLGGSLCAQVSFNPTLSEYNWSTSVSQLGMSNIHGRGILGRGVVVAVLDTGVNLQHSEFAGSGRLLTAYNATNGGTDVTDSSGHGTHVAGILTASGNGSGMYGVAPGATLLPIKVFSGATAPASAVTAGLDHAIANGARVVNLSLGATSPTGDTGLRRAAATNTAVIVIAAGNDGAAMPNWPGRYAKESWTNGTMLVVGAVNSQRRILSESNRAGELAPYYLVAPGVNIISAYGSGYSYMTGTSMATPAVSGAAALITGYWPYLQANQVATILLKTADDLGAPGVDAIYGHGMLNVNRALSPIGRYRYRLLGGGVTQISLATAGVTSTQPAISTPSAFGNVVTEVFDDFERNFTSQEGAALSTRTALTVEGMMGRAQRLADTTDTLLDDGARLTQLRWSERPSMTVASAQNGNASGDAWNHLHEQTQGYMAYQARDGRSLSFGNGGLSALSLGLASTDWGRHLSGLEGLLQNPLTRFSPQHQFISAATPQWQGWSVKAAALDAKKQAAARGDVKLTELTYIGARAALSLSTARLDEQGLLGGYSNDVMGLNQATQTRGWSLSGAYLLETDWAIAGNWSRTHTNAPAAQGLLTSATDIHAQALGLGVVHANWLKTGDRLSLSWQTPLSATSGTLQYTVVTQVDETGAAAFGTQTVTLKPIQREHTWDLRYLQPLGWGQTLTAAVSWRQNPDHDANAPDQWALGIRYQKVF